jgi:antitoxin component YwqK of YwqJK toxin-antitoxin module
MYKQAIESRYDYSEESEGATIDADVELKDNNFIMLEVNGYENSKLAMKQKYNNGIIVKNTLYSNGVVYSEKTYNEAGKIIEQKRFDDQGNVTSNTTYGYDNRGNIIASNRYQNGELQENEKWEYDTNNNEILSEHYVLGDLISKEVSEYTSDNIRIKFYVYTQEGLVSSEEVDTATGECIRKEYRGDQVSREEKFDSDGVQLYKYDYENGILKYKEIFTSGKVTMYENYNNGIITTHIEYEYNSAGEESKRAESYYNDNGELTVVVYYENDKPYNGLDG